MRIGIDLDGCVYDFVDSLRQYLVLYEGWDPDELPPETCWGFFWTDWGIPFAEFKRLCDDGVDRRQIFYHGAPIDDYRGHSVGALCALKAAGHSLHIVTDRNFGTHSASNTARWLGHFEIPFDSLTFSADKTCVPTDVFIDDRPGNVETLRAAGVEAWLLDNGREDQAGHEWLVDDWETFLGKVLS